MKKSKQMLSKAEVADILGEVLDTIPDDNNDTREALEIAKCEMSRRYRKHSKKHSGKAWTKYEDKKLLEMFRKKCSIGEICTFLGRTEKGISSHLVRLKVIKERKDLKKILNS